MAELIQDDKKVNVLVREIEFTKLVASNDPKTRNEGLKKLKSLIQLHSGDSEDAFDLNDYLRLWKGLFYFMWMSDKPLPQEAATEKISNLFHSCTSTHGKALFLEAFFLTIKDDWMSISQHRIDKFMMLVRRFLRQMFVTCVNSNWDLKYMEKLNVIFYNALKSFTLSLRCHVQEIFLEELAKVSRGVVPSEALVIILDAFLHYVSELNDSRLIREVTENVFKNLLSQSPDVEILEAKFLAWRKMGKPGRSYNDLELVEGDIENGDSNDQNNDGPLDPRAGNISVEIPRIKFNPKSIAQLLHRYVTEVDCTRKSLLELTKLLKYYNRLKEGVLPFKPKDLKLNSLVLKRNKKKHLSKLVKEGVKKLEMVDRKLKKNRRTVLDDHKSLKELNKLGEIIIEHGKIGKSIWKVRKLVENNASKENVSLNSSWTVSEETENKEESKSNDIEDEIPVLVPAGFNVEVTDDSPNKTAPVQEKIVTNVLDQNDVKDTTPKHKKETPIKSPKVIDSGNNTLDENNKQSNDLVLKKIKRRSDEIRANTSFNSSWSVTQDDEIKSSPKSPNKSAGSGFSESIETESIHNNSGSKSMIDNDYDLQSLNEKNKDENCIKRKSTSPGKVTSVIKSPKISMSPKNAMSPKSPKSPTPEKRVLRRRTIIIPKKKPSEDQAESTPKRKTKDPSSTAALRKRRKTIAGEDISMLKPDEISNKALEKVRSEAFDGFNTPRKSSRLSIKTDSAKKRVEFQLKNNIEQEFNEYETTLVTKPENPHDAGKQPACGVLKSTPDANRINPFYKFHDRSVKKNSRKSII
ncbi:ribosomal RNA processing protein 1 homolog [Adelges cooleyi]|uniref:ribosomal RNA processing protein 1 homolog n=1 Tax=Adelges cooleyi TaxID=133065 RepID=UPI0021808C10|nr:ribosomal RNA processing protein 1 homolog [Adelges cooleyi]